MLNTKKIQAELVRPFPYSLLSCYPLKPLNFVMKIKNFFQGVPKGRSVSPSRRKTWNRSRPVSRGGQNWRGATCRQRVRTRYGGGGATAVRRIRHHIFCPRTHRKVGHKRSRRAIWTCGKVGERRRICPGRGSKITSDCIRCRILNACKTLAISFILL